MNQHDLTYLLTHARATVEVLEEAVNLGIDEAWGGNQMERALRSARACVAWLELTQARTPPRAYDWKSKAANDQEG